MFSSRYARSRLFIGTCTADVTAKGLKGDGPTSIAAGFGSVWILFVILLLVPACEAFGFAAGEAALYVDDLSVAECEDLEALVASSVRSEPLG